MGNSNTNEPDLSSNGDRLIMKYSIKDRCYLYPVKFIGVSNRVYRYGEGFSNVTRREYDPMSREEIEILMNYQCSWNDICATMDDIQSNSGIKEMDRSICGDCIRLILFLLAAFVGAELCLQILQLALDENTFSEDRTAFLIIFAFIIFFVIGCWDKNRLTRQINSVATKIREILDKYKNKYDHLGMRWEIGNMCRWIELHLDYKFNRLYGMSNQIGGFNQPPIQVGNAMDYQMHNQGYNPGMNQGFNPEMNQGYNPGMNQGFNPGMNQGFNPGMNQGFNPGMNRGFNPGMNQGYNSGMNQGYNPGMNQGYNPGMNQSDNQGVNQGYNPGMNQGDNQGVNQGDNQGVNQSDNQGVNQANENAYQPPQLPQQTRE